MPGTIQVGGLATGLDTNSIIDQLVKLEQRPVDLLSQQLDGVRASQASFGTFGGKLGALRAAADALNTTAEVLVGKASSSNETVVTAAAGTGASRGTVTLDVTQLARGSVASATTGLPAASSTVATGAGTFSFQVGSGDVQSVQLTDTTTLEGLVSAINDLDAGVSASAVNLGTAASPDYRLSLVSHDTGVSNTITIVQDDTTLAVQTTQSGQNAQFTVSGFSGSFQRETNTFSDILSGVTFSLKDAGTATVTVNDDADAMVAKVKNLVTAFNDVVQFVAGESTITQGKTQNAVQVGSLAANSTVRRLVDRLHEAFSEALTGATSQFVNLSSLGLTTVGRETAGKPIGSIDFDETKFRDALAQDPTAAARVLAGNGVGQGVANGLSKLIADASGVGGVLAIDDQGFGDHIRELQDEIDAGQQRVAQFQASLSAQFTALETLVSGLRSQGDFLTAALAKL
jgi:flagellar hook-associated protein 2